MPENGQKKEASTGPVSRVLSWMIIYLGRLSPSVSSDLTREVGGQRHASPIRSFSGWGLPGRPVTRPPVRSYRTVAPLPPMRAAVYFCGTFPGVTPAGRYPAPCPTELGLSSGAIKPPRPSSPVKASLTLSHIIAHLSPNTKRKQNCGFQCVSSRTHILAFRTPQVKGDDV